MLAIAAIVSLGAVYAMVLPPLFGGLMGLSLPAKIAVAVGLLAPLGFVMGLPFLGRVSDSTPALVPWAWGINSCASVVAAVLAACSQCISGSPLCWFSCSPLHRHAAPARPESARGVSAQSRCAA
jgi:hypothetical protein